MKSIREFATELDVSHNTVRNVILRIEAATGKQIGTAQGKGKPTLLSEYEQGLIKSELNGKVEPSTEIIPYKADLGDVLTVTDFKVLDTSNHVSDLALRFESNHDTQQSNENALDAVLLTKFENQGLLLAQNLFNAKYGTAFNHLNALETALAKKQGVIAE